MNRIMIKILKRINLALPGLIAGILDTTVDYILNGDAETADEYTMQVVRIMAQIKSKEARKIAVKHLMLVVEMEKL